MALLDAFLLEAAPFSECIAYRTDRVKGSGKASDPWDGSPKLDNPLSITLVRSGNMATATLAAGHGLQNGNLVVITGATTDASAWNGTFTISNVQSTSFDYTMSAVPGTSPPGGTISASKVTGTKFDDVMNGLSASTKVCLGPTPPGNPFLTAGYADGVSGGWQLKPGMKIVGAGIDSTVVRLIGASDAVPSKHFFAFGHALTSGSPAALNAMDFSEISDLTVECNLANQSGSTFACGGVRLMGNHARVRRLKVKGWGTKSASVPCYAIAAITGEVTSVPLGVEDCGIEDCIVVEPAASASGALLTALHAGPKDESGSTLEAHGTGPLIRNCLVDCGWPTVSAEFRGISMSWCRAGLVEANQIRNTKYGGPYSSKTSIRDLTVRGNFFKGVSKGPFLDLGMVGPSLGTGSLTRSGMVLTVTITNHNLVAGDRVKLATSVGGFDGVYRVNSVNGDDFTITTSDTSAASASVTAANKVFSSGKILIEDNTVELATGGGGDTAIHLHDNGSGTAAPAPDYVHDEVIVQDNRIRYFDGAFDPAYTGTGIQLNGARNLLVRNNIVETADSAPIQNKRCRNATYFNNRRPDGVLLQGLNEDTARKYDELETEAEDAFVLAYMERRSG